MYRILTSVFCLLLFAGCSKQKIENSTVMLSRSWTLNKYYENGMNLTGHFDSVYTDYTLNFYDSGNYTQTYLFNGTTAYNKTGTWQFLNVVNQIQLTNDVQTVIYDITTLTESAFHFEHTDAGILKQYEMISN